MFHKKNWVFILLFFLLIQCKKHNPHNFTLITYGYTGIYNGIDPDPDKGNARYYVAKKWGINFDSPGCVVSGDDEKKAFWNNLEAIENIEDKYGDDWIEKFNKKIEIEYQKEKKLEQNSNLKNE